MSDIPRAPEPGVVDRPPVPARSPAMDSGAGAAPAMRASPATDATGRDATPSGPVPFPESTPDDYGAPAARPARGIAGWALAAAIVALAISLVVGWGFPVGVVAVVAAAMALRRPDESRRAARWAAALGILSLVYSAIWLAWAASQAALFA